jgi:hypothetical protein
LRVEPEELAARLRAAGAEGPDRNAEDPRAMPPTTLTLAAIEPLREAFQRRSKTQTVPPCADTAAMRLRALPASAQIIAQTRWLASHQTCRSARSRLNTPANTIV